jgi:hypothetical protein
VYAGLDMQPVDAEERGAPPSGAAGSPGSTDTPGAPDTPGVSVVLLGVPALALTTVSVLVPLSLERLAASPRWR